MNKRLPKFLALVLLALFAVTLPIIQTGCTAPSGRVVEVQTLKAVGHTAESAVALSAQLYRDHRITADQARAVNTLYDVKFQPAFRVAVNAVQMNLDSIASPELVDLASQISSLVNSYIPVSK